MGIEDLFSRFVLRRVATNEWRRQRFADEDFSGRSFQHLRIVNSRFVRCRFDDSTFNDLRVWKSSFEDCRFQRSNLRGAALGPVDSGRCNEFVGTDFSDAHLRETNYSSAVFDSCRFDAVRIDEVDFQGSRFSHCRFSGQLREVQFSQLGFSAEKLPGNEMTNIDFSEASLRRVQFKQLDLSNCKLPRDEWHVVIPEFKRFLLQAVDRLLKDPRSSDAELRLVLEESRRHAPQTGIGVLNRRDFYEMGRHCGERFDELVADV